MQITSIKSPAVRFGTLTPLDIRIHDLEQQWGGAAFFDPNKKVSKFFDLTKAHGISLQDVKQQYADLLEQSMMTTYPHTQDSLLTALENRIIHQQQKKTP